MPSLLAFELPIAIAGGVFLLVLAAEKLHQWRCRTVAHLATGPSGKPRHWVRLVPAIRSLAVATMAWALTTLLFCNGAGYGSQQDDAERRANRQHAVFVADLSPSMQLRDAGPDADQTRLQRMHEVVDAVLRRIDGEVVYSVYAFYTDSMPVILEAEDAELVRNVFDSLPIWFAMPEGKTDLGTGVRKSLAQLTKYPEGSITLFICTDGDTLPMGSLPKPPKSVRDIYVLGAGDTEKGAFIDDHMSRQDPAVLAALAGRLGGQYLDVNEKHVPTFSLGSLATGAGSHKPTWELVDVAIVCFAAGAVVLAFVPVLLEYLGSDWKIVRVARREALQEAAR